MAYATRYLAVNRLGEYLNLFIQLMTRNRIWCCDCYTSWHFTRFR